MDPEDALEETLERLDKHTIRELCKALHLDTDLCHDPEDLAQSLCATYGERGAVREVVDKLKQRGLHYEAKRLETMGTLHESFHSMFLDKSDFLRIHRGDLICSHFEMKPILDDLLVEGAISPENYSDINKQESWRKMRKLLSCLGRREEEILYDILKKHEPDFIKGLTSPRFSRRSKMSKTDKKFQDMSVSSPPVASWSGAARGGWVKLDPDVKCGGDGDAPTYSLRSAAGNFECSVSGLRWVCKEEVSFKYHFVSWEEHQERVLSLQYMPGGPLVDITVTDGKLHEVFMPHWICTDESPAILGRFAVLHIDTSGDVVEKPAEVTPTHVKLLEPVFSPRGVLMKMGFPVRFQCRVLIFKTHKEFLTLHVYLIPRDPALKKEIIKEESSSGHMMIHKPHKPPTHLRMNDLFTLTANVENTVTPEEPLQLKYESSDPNYFEIFISHPDSEFRLTLSDESGPVWSSPVRKGDYINADDIWVLHETFSVRTDFVDRVGSVIINQLVDDLFADRILNSGECEAIRQLNTREAQARCLVDTVVNKGSQAKWKMIIHLKLRDPTFYNSLMQVT